MKLKSKLGLTCALALGTVASVATIGFTTISCSSAQYVSLNNNNCVFNPSDALKTKISKGDLDTINNNVANLIMSNANSSILLKTGKQDLTNINSNGIPTTGEISNQNLTTSLNWNNLSICFSLHLWAEQYSIIQEGDIILTIDYDLINPHFKETIEMKNMTMDINGNQFPYMPDQVFPAHDNAISQQQLITDIKLLYYVKVNN